MNIDSFLKTNASKVTSFVIIKKKIITVEALGRNTSTQLLKMIGINKSLDALIFKLKFPLLHCDTAESCTKTLLLMLLLMVKAHQPAEWALSLEFKA